MPWHVTDDHDDCDGWAVVKDDDGSVAGCHETEDAANQQMAALYANEGKAYQHGPARKALKVADFKSDGGPGEFTAHFSVFDVLDTDGDYVRKGAFLPAFEANPHPAVVWTHRWDVPPIGETLDADETEKGARGHGRLFVDDHDVARQVFAGLKSGALRQFSYSYDVAEGGGELREPKDGETALRADGLIRELTEFAAVHEWGPTLLGANPATELLAAKSLEALIGVAHVPPHTHQLDLAGMPGHTFSANTSDAWVFPYALPAELVKAGARNSGSDLERLQAIHDYAVENGAQCAKSGRPAADDRPDPDAALRLLFASPGSER